MNSLPHGWTAHQTHDGRWYYAHASGTTQWHPPQSYPSAPPPPPAGYPSHGHAPTHQPQHYQQTYSNKPPARPQKAQPSSSSSHAQPHAVASSQYVYSSPVEFKLKEKVLSLSGDSFSVKRTDTKQAVFKVAGNAFSFRDSKSLLDTKDRPIYKMQESIISLRGRMQILDASTRTPVITLRKKGFIPMFGTSTIQAWAGSTDDGPPTYEIKGDFFRKDFIIREVATGQSVAQVRRKSFSLSNILLEKDSYVIRVEPGRDAALMVFFVIAVDEQYRDDGNRKGYGSRLGGLADLGF